MYEKFKIQGYLNQVPNFLLYPLQIQGSLSENCRVSALPGFPAGKYQALTKLNEMLGLMFTYTYSKMRRLN